MLPKNRAPTPPGEMLLKEFLEPMHLTQKAFAAHLGWTYARLNEIINGRRGVTAASAIAFSDALGTKPEFWLALQMQYDLWVEYQHHEVIPPIAC
jgi:addiction module HigA family antidote